MALIFRRFDKADESVRDALIALARVRKNNEEFSKDQVLKFSRSARVLFNYALQREPEVTIKDLGRCIHDLGLEAQHDGILGKYGTPGAAEWRFKSLIHPRRAGGEGGDPSPDEKYMTLDEMAAVWAAWQTSARVQPRRQGGAR
ncbi:hypothetical protein DSM110093_04251 (plasmid) [Sulfitobacter sp. DSM 110093]|uniref:hypothetical protein n=1 Tax=Sulfitobacter sp. DSM 110093 TaxID=2883127 RepID=UPI001FADF5E1|nr:hypothetical protein [Sulfitobacter sp. DSM 110093]UOA34415.1 hypothetical protein DSM110093_04251 [Sulfitobacter sp. DSM 110093]